MHTPPRACRKVEATPSNRFNCDDREEVVVTRAGHESVVMVSLDDYQSLKETAYLLRNPENARRLITAIERLEAGGGTQHELAK